MPRKTTLALISERPASDPAEAANAAAALEAATAPTYALAPPQDVLLELRRQAATATQLAADAAGRAERAELALHETQAAAASEREKILSSAGEQVGKIRADAKSAIDAAVAQGAAAEKAAVAAARIQQTTGVLAQLVSYLVERAPVLATLTGAYLLARDMLPNPGVMQLGLLGIYGAVGVLPAVWWSFRK